MFPCVLLPAFRLAVHFPMRWRVSTVCSTQPTLRYHLICIRGCDREVPGDQGPEWLTVLRVVHRGRRIAAGLDAGGCVGLGRDLGLVVEPQIAVVDFQRQGGEGRAVDPAALGPVEALVGVPAPGLVARCGAGGRRSGRGSGRSIGSRARRRAGRGPAWHSTSSRSWSVRGPNGCGAGIRRPRCWRGRGRRRPGTGGRPRPPRSWWA